VTTEYEVWVPTCPETDADDDAIIASPMFRSIKEAGAFVVGGKKMTLPDAQVLPIARNYWQKAWEAAQAAVYSDDIVAFFERVNEGRENPVLALNITLREGDDGEWIGSYTEPKSTKKKSRFRHDSYRLLIGYGEEDRATEGENLKRKRDDDLIKLAKHGGFILVKMGSQTASKNGTFEFVLSEGDENNKVCPDFRAVLYQYAADGRKLPEIVFPPASGDKNVLRSDEDVVEVSSMSKVMKRSILGGAQTPAVMFALSEVLAIAEEDVDEDESDEDESEAEADEDENVNVDDLLDDEDEDEDEE
jgi:hypothetical protein